MLSNYHFHSRSFIHSTFTWYRIHVSWRYDTHPGSSISRVIAFAMMYSVVPFVLEIASWKKWPPSFCTFHILEETSGQCSNDRSSFQNSGILSNIMASRGTFFSSLTVQHRRLFWWRKISAPKKWSIYLTIAIELSNLSSTNWPKSRYPLDPFDFWACPISNAWLRNQK